MKSDRKIHVRRFSPIAGIYVRIAGFTLYSVGNIEEAKQINLIWRRNSGTAAAVVMPVPQSAHEP